MNKKIKLLYILPVIILFSVNAKVCIPGIGDKAPGFTADTNKGIINFPQDYKGKWVIFFSHPADFTPICETEFKRLASMVDEFEQLNTKLLGISVDSKYIHEVWTKELERQMGSSKRKINFPIVADLDKKVSKLYGLVHPRESKAQTVRAIYFIDPKGIIRALFYYPISNGRNFKEVKRLLQALQITAKTGEATAAEWQPGKATVPKDKTKIAHYNK